ncbi:MAG TPA: hypothetical protein PLY36_03120 [Spirochaetota bacterium]|nr:hypothetical protein [Spirochaetota bacterium]
MLRRMRKLFKTIIINSLSTQQVNYLGVLLDKKFDLYRESGFSSTTPIPRQTAADILMYRFKEEEDIVSLFSILLRHEGERFYNRDLVLWGKEDFCLLLKHLKWVYDRDLKLFFRDPFYEHEINFLNKIHIIDLRSDADIDKITKSISAISKKMSIQDLEWRITVRLYDLEAHTGELVRKIIDLLLSRQNLQSFTGELFFCFKELAINASKANYKLLFQKYVTEKQGIRSEDNYKKFLELFKAEIEESGNSNLLELAKKDDRFYTITFQSSLDSIEIWVTNTQNITLIEKEQILKKLSPEHLDSDNFFDDDDDNTEGAGLGLTLIINVLKKYSTEANPLKVVFYADFVKIGFELKRTEMKQNITDEV